MNLEFKISISDFDSAAWKRLQAARKEVSNIEAEIMKAYNDSPRMKAALDLAGFSDYGSKLTPVSRIETSRIVTNVTVDTVEPKGTVTRQLYLGEKTINALLNGKLLTDDQKKALLKQVGVDLDELSEKAGA